MYTSEYPPFYVTADIVVLRYGKDVLQVLLIKRKADPYKDCWALPGGFVNMDETVEEAACRELAEETGIQREPAQLTLTGVWSKPDRDPRMRVVSNSFLTTFSKDAVRAGDDAAGFSWVPVSQIENWNLAFDHLSIIRRSLGRFG